MNFKHSIFKQKEVAIFLSVVVLFNVFFSFSFNFLFLLLHLRSFLCILCHNVNTCMVTYELFVRHPLGLACNICYLHIIYIIIIWLFCTCLWPLANIVLSFLTILYMDVISVTVFVIDSRAFHAIDYYNRDSVEKIK